MAKILLVEDDNNLREIYEARLQAEGYTIISAQDGEEALVKAKQEKPDLIISDVMMPRISGFEMLDILRNTEGLKDTKVIMLTALGQAEDQTRADSLGADRYLVKSQVTLEDIVKAAGELLNAVSSAATATTADDSSDSQAAATDNAQTTPSPQTNDAPVAATSSNDTADTTAIPVATPGGIATPSPVVTPPSPSVTNTPPAMPATAPQPSEAQATQTSTPEATGSTTPTSTDGVSTTNVTQSQPETTNGVGAATAPNTTDTSTTPVPAASTSPVASQPTAQQNNDNLIADAVRNLTTGSTTVDTTAHATAVTPQTTAPAKQPNPETTAPATTTPATQPQSEAPVVATQPPQNQSPAATSAENTTDTDDAAAIQKQLNDLVAQETIAAPETTEGQSETAEPATPAATAMDTSTGNSVQSVAPSEPAVAATTPTPETTDTFASTSESDADDDSDTRPKKIIQPLEQPVTSQPNLSELLAKEGLGVFEEHPAGTLPTTPHPPGHVIAPNAGNADTTSDWQAPVAGSTITPPTAPAGNAAAISETTPGSVVPATPEEPSTATPPPFNPNDPNNIAL